MIEDLGVKVKAASKEAAKLSAATKNNFLLFLADTLIQNTSRIIFENERDLLKAKEHGISDIMVDRLRLTPERISDMALGLRQVADLPDPIGQVLQGFTNLDGLKIVQKRVPLGTVGMIFESRPNVTIDAFSLCFKTGNSVLLRGGFGLVGLVGPLASIEKGLGVVAALLAWLVIPVIASLVGQFLFEKVFKLYDRKDVFEFLG